MAQSKPLLVMGDFELHTLEHVSERAFAEAFVEIAQRGNPLLQDRPCEDLLALGQRLMARADPMSTVLTSRGGAAVLAVHVTWDMRLGQIWDGSEIPESLQCHAAVASACCDTLATWDRMHYGIFGGLKVGLPSALMALPGLFAWLGAAYLGHDHRFGVAVHPTVVKMVEEPDAMYLSKRDDGQAEYNFFDQFWVVSFDELDLPEDVMRTLRCAKLSSATCMMTDLSILRERFEDVLDTFEPVKRAAFAAIGPIVKRHLAGKGLLPNADVSVERPVHVRSYIKSSKL